MNDMSGPWYEKDGPSACDVRKDIFKKIRNKLIFCDEGMDGLSDKNLNEILLEYIPDTMTNFGSWRGYATFGLDQTIKNNIVNAVNIIIQEQYN